MKLSKSELKTVRSALEVSLVAERNALMFIAETPEQKEVEENRKKFIRKIESIYVKIVAYLK